MTFASLDAVAARQYGLLTRPQALLRMTADQLELRLAKRELIPVRPGVYRFQGAPPSWEQHLLAACLATAAVASHRSAARVWGLGRIAALRLEVTVPLGRVVRLNGVRAHRSTLLGPEFVTTHREIPVMTPARTLIDLSAVASPPRVRDAVDEALRERLVAEASEHVLSFDWADVARQIAAVYEDVTAPGVRSDRNLFAWWAEEGH